MHPDQIAPYAPAVLKLLQGVLYHDDPAAWNLLLLHQTAIQEYFARIGLQVYLSEADGFAFLRQPEIEREDGPPLALPRLTRRDRLSYHLTLLCVLLRERLDQFDAGTPESDRLLLAAEDIHELMRPFLRERGNELALIKKIDETANRAADLGFLRRQMFAGEEQWEVRRIIKARIDADMLAEIKAKLEDYGNTDA
ncbi:MAG: DUF4194 domain-containing protein [Oscillochloris sp.]|nr:DUF4194 domain-containing protein [Oscillochloris sp.]